MYFAHPYLLLLLLSLPILAWLRGRHGQESAFLYSSVKLVKPLSNFTRSRAGRILLRLRWLTLALLIVALAQPRWLKGEGRVRASGVDIVIALDLSESMSAEDFELKGERVNRLAIAKNVIEKFVSHRPDDRLGLVAFAGEAYIASPQTLDHSFFLQNLQRLDLKTIRQGGTAIGSAIAMSVNRVRDLKSKSKLIILMTDGQNNAGKIPPLTAAEAAHALGLKVYSIGVGTHGTAPQPYNDVFGIKRYREVPVDIDEKTLAEIAKITGGKYYRADNSETLMKIYAEIDRLEKTDVEVRKFQQYEELFKWAILAAVTVLLLETLLAHTLWRKLP